MFKFNNTHIFTGYLKQLLSSFNLPACKVYTNEFIKYLEQHGEEDPRVLESFDVIDKERLAVRVSYLRNNEVYNYFKNTPPKVIPIRDANGKTLCWRSDLSDCSWRKSSDVFYSSEKTVRGLTKHLNSPGISYDAVTHEYLGEYLRFMRDYYNVNLMSLYNCFNDKIYNNINFSFNLTPAVKITFNAQDPNYRIYAIPVRLFAEYTVAIDCSQGIEMFCGLYNTNVDKSDKAVKLAAKTYLKINKTLFKQPFLYDKLNITNWPASVDFIVDETTELTQIQTKAFTRWEITNREQDLRLFIKVPVSCRSSITILEGDYRNFNDFMYLPIKHSYTKTENGEEYTEEKTVWAYQQNNSIINFNTKKRSDGGDEVDLNEYNFKPISKLQLLAFNTGESYPFADRLIEYLGGSAITSIDPIPDNIKRVQRVMKDNKNYFKIEGIWEDKMQNILYDYIINSGPIIVSDATEKLSDKRQGYNSTLGHTSKSTLYDVLGYVDRDAEKWYASWKIENNKAQVKDSIQNVDIYNRLYDID